ncbi:IclR family transcriptional regulator [Metasolibacillus sp. FSL H7-0170]|uniref:IclR family transcriptional regulator n=1 Tax=Metasolibacillus TaxID=2703677 RepID=UPI000D3A9AB9|nr:IclR family transcriptional regulator [Metasolibacillus fluoroglycofenilyticus]
MQLLERCVKIAKALMSSDTHNGLSISDLAQKCDLPISTLHRILQAMIQQGMVEQNKQTKHYHIGTIWMEIGLQIYDSQDFINVIRPELQRLSKEVGESVYLSKMSGTDTIIIERIDNITNPIRIYDPLGIRIPMHIGSGNKALLAAMSDEEVTEILSQLVTPKEIEQLKKQLMQIKAKGFAVSHGEFTKGTSAVSAVVYNGFNEIEGVVTIDFVSFNVSDEHIQTLANSVIDTAKRISLKLGYKGGV